MKNYIYIAIAAIFILGGCRKFVEIDQIGVRTLKYTSDYRNVMNDNSVLESGWGYPILSGDDTYIYDATRQGNITDIWAATYTWKEKYLTEAQGDSDWEKLYKAIYSCNEVTNGVLSSQGGTVAAQQQVYAEALVHRAYSYLCLVNIYGKQYDEATAATDLGVPLLLTPDLFAKLDRSSIKVVYEQIINDLKHAVNLLPDLPDYNVRPAKVSTYALLARAYLNQRNFTQAALYSDSALAIQNTLLDLNAFAASPATFPKRLLDPEIMLSKNITGSYTAIPINNDMLTLLGTNDLRYSLFTNTRGAFGSSFAATFTGRAYWRYTLNGEFVIPIGPSVPEVMLIKAECAARAGDAATAMEIVNKLRIKRVATANYVALNATDATDALVKVIDERKRELFGRGFRWFDQKRLNKDAAFATTVTRVFKDVTYTLEPNSNRYVYPIGDKYILLNPEIAQNPR